MSSSLFKSIPERRDWRRSTSSTCSSKGYSLFSSGMSSLPCGSANVRNELARSLREFAVSGDNRLIIVPGNHDAVLLFPKVAKTLLARIGAPAERASVLAQGYWLSPDQQIYAEHGHQIGEELNRFDGWPRPFIAVKKTQYIQRPWGEQMVQQFYNDYEKKYPVIDNFTDDSIGLGYGFAAEGKVGSFAGGARFFRMALFQMSLQQFARSLGGEAGTHERRS